MIHAKNGSMKNPTFNSVVISAIVFTGLVGVSCSLEVEGNLTDFEVNPTQLAENPPDRSQEVRGLTAEETIAMCKEFAVNYDTQSAIISHCYTEAFERSYHNPLVNCETFAANCIANPLGEVLMEVDLGCEDSEPFQQECAATVGDLEGCFTSMSNLFTDFAVGLTCGNVLERVEALTNSTPECVAAVTLCPEFQ